MGCRSQPHYHISGRSSLFLWISLTLFLASLAVGGPMSVTYPSWVEADSARVDGSAIHDTIKLLNGDVGFGLAAHCRSPLFFFDFFSRTRGHYDAIADTGAGCSSEKSGYSSRKALPRKHFVEFFGVTHFIVEHTVFGGDSWCLMLSIFRPWSWECPAPGERWMLGCVFHGQPAVILRVSTVRRWMLGCVRQPTVIFRVTAMKKVNASICAPPTTDHDPAGGIPDKRRKFVIFDFFMRTYCFWNQQLFFFWTQGLTLRILVVIIFVEMVCSFALKNEPMWFFKEFRPHFRVVCTWLKIVGL